MLPIKPAHQHYRVELLLPGGNFCAPLHAQNELEAFEEASDFAGELHAPSFRVFDSVGCQIAGAAD